MNAVHRIAHAVWASLPRRIRPYLLIEPLRLMLPKALNHSGEGQCCVVGFFSAPSGLGRGARLFLREKNEQGTETCAVDITRLTMHAPGPATEASRCALPPDALENGTGTVVVHANPPAFMAALWAVRRLLRGKRVVAYWAWELEDIPHYWTRCLDFVDEVLVPGSFVAEAVRKHTNKPVRTHPHADFPPARPRQRAGKRPFTVLSCFDCGANFYRKNPLAAVAAFKTAFGDDPNALLVLKAGNMERCPEGRRLLAKAADGPNIRFCLGNFSESGVDELYAEADVYLSLHRSEGYGLTIREAMSRGLPVIATGWSGNMDFMRGAGVHPVPYTLVPVDDPQGMYNLPGARWAEPDIEAAADMLRLTASAIRGKACS
ncbi:MAG: glycosyltransferase family 4 protein [Prevotellaceae bacterium]|nr:glycosyltransferase family 4 protein [Prevotellaceae bacterium]